ncbi:MAG: glycosyltransferase [Chitinivibrionales bacterium]|nr:glycosyltransferase [Chitinivibrionales bacterium]MBD3396585.1 glycosyltransferase [Chitinivibrionales bacterium]
MAAHHVYPQGHARHRPGARPAYRFACKRNHYLQYHFRYCQSHGDPHPLFPGRYLFLVLERGTGEAGILCRARNAGGSHCMRLLLTLDYPPERGGIQKYLHGIVRYTYSAGDMVIVGCMPRHRRHADDTAAPVTRVGLPFSQINKKLSLAAMLPPLLARAATRSHTLTVECGNVYTALLPWMMRPVLPLPYRVYTYGTELVALRNPSPARAALLCALKGAHGIYALGPYTEKLVRQLGCTCPVEHIPPKIVLPEKAVPSRKRHEGDVFRILSVGRLVQHKGHHVLVNAVAGLPEECDWTLRVVGTGPKLPDLRRQRQSLPRPERIMLDGELSDRELQDAYGNADAFVLSSLETTEGTEGFGIVLLEAMSHHVPVVASATGGINDVLEDGQCGLLVRPGDVDALRATLVKLWQRPSLGTELTERAYERLRAHYVWH